MAPGIPYDSDAGRAMCAAITALMTGDPMPPRPRWPSELGPFPGYAENREAMLRVIRNHRRAAYGDDRRSYDGLTVLPVPLVGRPLPGPGSGHGAATRLGPGAVAGRSATASQRPGHRDRARPAPSGWSWIATPPASSPTSPWSNSRSWPAAAISRSSTAWCPQALESLGYDQHADRRDHPLCGRRTAR